MGEPNHKTKGSQVFLWELVKVSTGNFTTGLSDGSLVKYPSVYNYKRRDATCQVYSPLPSGKSHFIPAIIPDFLNCAILLKFRATEIAVPYLIQSRPVL